MAHRRFARYLRLAGLGFSAAAVGAVIAWGFADGNATVVTAATALIVLAVGEYRRWQIAAQQDRWGRIAGEYEKFFALIRRQVEDGNDDPAPKTKGPRRQRDDAARSSEDVEQQMATLADKLMLWGSPRVIKAWVQMRRNASEGQPPLNSLMEEFGRIVLAMRREFGHSDLRLEERDLFRIMFNDEIEVMLATANLRDGREILRALGNGGGDQVRFTSPTLSATLNMPLRQVEHILTWFQREKPPFVQRVAAGDGSEEHWTILPAGQSALDQLEEKDFDEE